MIPAKQSQPKPKASQDLLRHTVGSCLSSVRRTTALREEVVDRVTLALGAWTDSAPVESPAVYMNVHQPTRQGILILFKAKNVLLLGQ